MSKKNQEEIIFNIVKHNPSLRTEQIKIMGMQAGISCADRYLRWLAEEGREYVRCYKKDKDNTKTWVWTGKPYFIAKKDHPKLSVEGSGQLCMAGVAACFGLAAVLLFGTPASAGYATGEEMTKAFEGYRSEIYTCTAGVQTIGYGFNIEEDKVRRLLSPAVLSGKAALQKEEAEHVFDVLYLIAEVDAIAFVGKDTFMRLSFIQQDILIDMAYNLGLRNLLTFKKMRAAIQAGDYVGAAVEMQDSKWYRQTGRRARQHVDLFALEGTLK